jgi:FtsH-binding integral membrane protein
LLLAAFSKPPHQPAEQDKIIKGVFMAQAKAIRATSAVRFNRFLALVYLVMAVGMAVTALVATSVSNNPELMKRILFYPWFTFGLFMLQIIVVVWLSAAVMRMSPAFAFLLFLVYSALTGLALSSIFIYYSQTTIAYTFWVTAGMFLFGSVVGFFIFPFSPGLNQAMNFTGIMLFAGLTVWDTNRLKQLAADMEGKQGMGGMVVIGALALYLDFINLFLLLLRTSRR